MKNKKVIIIGLILIMVAIIVGVVLLTSSGKNSTNNNSKGISDTKDIPKKPVVLLPDPPNISEKYLNDLNSNFTNGSMSQAEVIEMIDNMIDEAYEKYGRYLNENISKTCVKIGLTGGKYNLGGITPEALKKVNDLITANGEEPLGQQEPAEKIAALWISASLYFDPNYYDNDPYSNKEWGLDWRYDIAMAFAFSIYSHPDGENIYEDIYMTELYQDIRNYKDSYASTYAKLFKIWEPSY